ncbi:MAG TPA: COX15/CtaA family protein [Burkholderiales bacterium]|nr:COX15/CtaA family protein [Burkholderiales bacterium]
MNSAATPPRAAPPSAQRAVAAWLIACCALVFAMVVVGGLTRLTESGLSIVEWQPISGVLPPLGDADWRELFEKYQRTPQYQQVNRDMSLEEFKGIFWLEYFHRLLGRLVGLAFLLPYLYFLARRRLERGLAWKLAGVFALGAAQGVLGWLMVASGLVSEPRVSHLRLTAHLALAFAIYAAMLWIALDLLLGRGAPQARSVRGRLAAPAWTVTGLVAFMVLTGGLVAGLRAGRAYNTFPLMDGHLVPPEAFLLEPWWKNFFYNMATVQLDHRLGAYALLAAVAWLWVRALRLDVPRSVRALAHLLAAAVLAQAALGVSTLLAGVPIALATLHQAGALVVLTVALVLAHRIAPPAPGR